MSKHAADQQLARTWVAPGALVPVHRSCVCCLLRHCTACNCMMMQRLLQRVALCAMLLRALSWGRMWCHAHRCVNAPECLVTWCIGESAVDGICSQQLTQQPLQHTKQHALGAVCTILQLFYEHSSMLYFVQACQVHACSL